MAEGRADQRVDAEHLVAGLKQRAERERAAGGYADDLSDFELQPPRPESAPGARVRFRPELGFSSRPLVGPVITFVKRGLLRLQLYVFEDLAKQADSAIARVDEMLAVEIAKRERLESELRSMIRQLEEKVRQLEDAGAEARRQRRAR